MAITVVNRPIQDQKTKDAPRGRPLCLAKP